MKKVCKQCNKLLDIDYFYKNNTYKDGHSSTCKVCTNEYSRNHYIKNINEKREYRKKYYQENKEDSIKKSVEWGKANKDKRKVTKDKWRSKNKELTNHLTRQYNYRRKGATGNHTIKEWKELCDLFDNKCICCGLETKLTEDHIIPLSKGGSDLIENIQPLCVSCNSKKGNRDTINYKILNKNDLQ